MKVLGWAQIVALTLAAACGAQAGVGADAKGLTGQEFSYSGTAEWQQSMTGHPAMTQSGPVQIAALVTGAAPGYAVIVMRTAQPRMGRSSLVPVADVRIDRLAADARPFRFAPWTYLSGPIGEALRLVTVPLIPRAELGVGRTWKASEWLPMLMPRPIEMVYTVAGKTSIGGRACLTVDKRAALALPLRADLGRFKITLTGYRGTLCLDEVTGQVVREEEQASVRRLNDRQETRLNLKVGVTLLQTRRLPANEVASRVAQAEALEKAQATLFAYPPQKDVAKWATESTRVLAAFRERFPGTPYAPALVPLERYVTMRRSMADREARLQAMMGKPAPEFRIPSLAGEEQSLGAYRGKLILLNFFASW